MTDGREHGVASRVARAAKAVGIDPKPLTRVANALAAEVNAYADLSIDSHLSTIGLQTVGHGDPFVDRVAALLSELAAPPQELDRLRRTATALGPSNLLVRVGARRDAAPTLRWVLRRRPDIDRLCALHASEGMASEPIALVRAAAAILQKRTAHFVGRELHPEGWHSVVYLSQFARDPLEVRDRIRAVSALILDDETGFDSLIPLLRLPAGCSAFLGIQIPDAGSPRLRLTTPGFPAPGIFQVLELTGRMRRRVELLSALEDAAGVSAAGWVAADLARDSIGHVSLTKVRLSYPIQVASP